MCQRPHARSFRLTTIRPRRRPENRRPTRARSRNTRDREQKEPADNSRTSSARRNKSAAAGNSPARSFPIPTTCAPCPANRSAIFFISFLLLIALWTRCERSFLQGHFTLARDDSLASINKLMAFTVREIESPDPVTRVAAEEAKLREADHDIGEKMILNMGPSHPATHGVLRLVLELDGEVITKAMPDVGFLHRGDEKIAENMQYNQFVPYTDRLDYLAPLSNNVAY